MKILEGKLVSKKIKDTYVVEVSRVRPHPLYKKLVKLSKKYKVDNTGFEDLDLGSQVRISETRPISKGKYFKISDVLTNENKKNRKTVKKVDAKGKEKSSDKKKTKNK